MRKCLLKIKPLFLNTNIRLYLSLIFGLIVNAFYIASNFISALVYHSLWSATITIYHLMLMIIRIYILSSRRVGEIEGRAAGLCLRVGIFMLLLDLSSAFMMIYSMKRGIFVRYSGIILLGFLIYTIYSVTKSSLDIRRHASHQRPIYYVARNISLSTSLMSVFNLQYSLLSLFGANYRLTAGAIFLCGALVFSIILALSLRLIFLGRIDRFR